MLAYAAHRPRAAARQSSPNTMLLILCGHIVVIAAVMSAKMDLPRRIFDPPTTVVSIPIPTEPLPIPEPAGKAPHPTQSSSIPRRQTETVDQPQPQVPIDVGGGTGPTGEARTLTTPRINLPSKAFVASTGPRLLTLGAELKPPYPRSKILAEEEAALTLRLTIDEHGQVVGVEPVGAADPVFLDAARRHLLAHWRYSPATEDGRAVSTSIVITLHFRLDG
jgi:protein TonB